MRVVHTIDETRRMVSEAKAAGRSVALVPTMGYFHEGHLSLMRYAKAHNDFVVVSIFVNPTQFGPKEDFAAYPRDLQRDSAMAECAGADLIFNPAVEEMYPPGYNTYVEVEKLTEGLCGDSRPGHFRGVATVVLKLFNIVQPDRAYFGQKDWQQLKVIQRMVRDLNVPVEVVGLPIVRESDGLAMSSRNTYLSTEERQSALVLSRALKYAQRLVDEGVVSVPEIVEKVQGFIAQEPLANVEYVSLVDPESLECLDVLHGDALLALAVRIGRTRLIDNAVLRRG